MVKTVDRSSNWFKRMIYAVGAPKAMGEPFDWRFDIRALSWTAVCALELVWLIVPRKAGEPCQPLWGVYDIARSLCEGTPGWAEVNTDRKHNLLSVMAQRAFARQFSFVPVALARDR